MAQLSLRLDDDLHGRAKAAASASGISLNGFIARVLRVAVDPSEAEPEADRIRARLAAAGMITSPEPPAVPAHSEADEARFQAAFARSSGGTSGSSLITEERGGGW